MNYLVKFVETKWNGVCQSPRGSGNEELLFKSFCFARFKEFCGWMVRNSTIIYLMPQNCIPKNGYMGNFMI
jgi:hypothetical protein